ncbi:MAG: hypothetical protein R2744_12875, partial [Bacteroidales bacterium]
MNRIPFMMVVLVIISVGTVAQEASPGQNIISYIESIQGYDPEESIQLLTDEIGNLVSQPVRVNSGSELEISRLFFLTEFQVLSLARYVRTHGDIISLPEIATIDGFDRELTLLMEPFIILEPGNDAGYSRGRGKIIASGIYKSSYIDDDAPGSPVRLLTKADFTSSAFNAGITVEKDQGEKVVNENWLPDFLSGFVSFRSEGIIRNITIGDMRVRFGQGLVTWTGFSVGSSPLDQAPMKGMASISPYRSTDENNFFRGAGITMEVGKGT